MAADPFPPDLPTSFWGLVSLLFGGMATAIGVLWRALQASNQKRAEREVEHFQALLDRDRQAIEANNRTAVALEKQTEVMQEAIRHRRSQD